MIKLNKIYNNLYEVQGGTLRIYFSYETPIAFVSSSGKAYIAKNIWSRTTGKHLNMVKNIVSDPEEIDFEELLRIIKLYI